MPLYNPDNASLVLYNPPTQKVVRTQSAKDMEWLSLYDWGAVGGNSGALLNTRFATLAAAQVKYPFVTDITTQSIDYAAIQSLVTYAIANNKAVFVPADDFVILGGTVQIPNGTTMWGFPNLSRFNNQTHILGVSQFTNADPAGFVNVTIEGIDFYGGSTAIGLNVTSECAYNNFIDCRFVLQTGAGISVNKNFQVSNFINCIFTLAPQAIYNPAGVFNLVNFIGCGFTSMSQTSIQITDPELVNFIGCRFEAGGANTGYATISMSTPNNVNFSGCYFEATHPLLLSETGSNGTTCFDQCHFTYGDNGGASVPYVFTSDGVVNFGTNSFTVDTVGPTKMFIRGQNDKLGFNNQTYISNNRHKIEYVSSQVASATFTPVTTTLVGNLFTVTRAGSSGATSNWQVITGRIRCQYSFISSGGFLTLVTQEVLVTLYVDGTGNIVGIFNNVANNTSGASAITCQLAAGASTTTAQVQVVIAVAPVVIGALLDKFSYSVEFDKQTTLVADDFTFNPDF